jgi:hypothetical protein
MDPQGGCGSKGLDPHENTFARYWAPQDWITHILAVWGHWSSQRRPTRTWEMSESWRKNGLPAASLSSPSFTLNILAEMSDNSLVAKGWIRDMPSLVTTDTETPVTMASLTSPEDSSRGRQVNCTIHR